jgi:DNA helicase HerA-like ATPase
VHNLIVGIGGSGKSTLARVLASGFRNRQEEVLVLDPNKDEWPTEERYIFDDPLRFLKLAKKSQRCALFIDEAGEVIGRGKHAREMQWITTRSRHWGHRVFLICQRATQIELTIRSQCTTGYIFRQSPGDSRALADTFADDALLEASTLQKGEYLHVVTCQSTIKRKLSL